MHGFYGRILSIDLSRNEFNVEPLADELMASCLGGKGLATRLLLERNPIGVDPLAPENHLIINTGPFCQGRLDYDIDYGDVDKIADLLEKIAAREGIGDILADGIIPAASK